MLVELLNILQYFSKDRNQRVVRMVKIPRGIHLMLNYPKIQS